MATMEIPADSKLLYAYYPNKVNYAVLFKLTPQAVSSVREGAAGNATITLKLGSSGVRLSVMPFSFSVD